MSKTHPPTKEELRRIEVRHRHRMARLRTANWIGEFPIRDQDIETLIGEVKRLRRRLNKEEGGDEPMGPEDPKTMYLTIQEVNSMCEEALADVGLKVAPDGTLKELAIGDVCQCGAVRFGSHAAGMIFGSVSHTRDVCSTEPVQIVEPKS